MGDLRKEFEALPEISGLIKSRNMFYSDVHNVYWSKPHDALAEGYFNGAWFAFQAQQKKIDAIKQHVVSFYAEADLWGFDSGQAIRQIDLIQELLK